MLDEFLPGLLTVWSAVHFREVCFERLHKVINYHVLVQLLRAAVGISFPASFPHYFRCMAVEGPEKRKYIMMIALEVAIHLK
jgi:hypothetical protein